ncbi:MAG: type II secretion system protein [Campylobacterota bacterium]|nr:type II secretion system protein [Campylobacterota bacterium]
MYSKKFRPAVAMVELIFAIVIMGIAMMSAPMLISSASKSTFVALQQEGINEVSTRINIIMGYAWDEQSTDYRYVPPILHVTDGANELDVDGNTGRRVGTPEQSQRTFILSDANGSTDLNATTTLGSEGDEDDIDDFIGVITLSLVEDADVDYIEKTTVNIKTDVSYASDTVEGGYSAGHTISYAPFGATAGSSNIKTIEVTLTSTSSVDELNDKKITLRAFSCNVGGYKFEERVF